MRHRLLAIIGYPAHLLNRASAGTLSRIGLGRLPAALPIGLAIGALAVSNAASTAEAYAQRPEPILTTVSAIESGAIDSGLWVVFDAVLVDGPHLAALDVFSGNPTATQVQRTYYLVGDPDEPDHAVVVRARTPIDGLESPGSRLRIDGSIAEDAFGMRRLLESWDPGSRHPEVAFGSSRVIAYAFATPWQEPSYLVAGLLGTFALIVLVGAFIRHPVLRRTRSAAGARGRTPIELAVHGELSTPRGMVRLDGTPARLQWMTVEEIAKVRWRYWGAALGDMRRAVESAVGEHGAQLERLVLHGPAGSLIWPIERPGDLRIEPGEAFLGVRRRSALGIRGDGAAVVLTFSDPGSRDSAAAELGSLDRGDATQ